MSRSRSDWKNLRCRLKPGQCDGFQGVKGFRLSRIAGGATTVLHEDTSIPGSRNCPIGYSIGGIQTFYPRWRPTGLRCDDLREIVRL
jgi:hypothetical protein